MFQQKAEDRLRSWREFRNSLDSMTLDHALQAVAEYWSRTPYIPYYLDPDNLSVWPDPWTLISENYYCDIARCLGIVYTIALTTHKKDLDIEIRIYNDPVTHYSYNLAWINQGLYILNLTDSEVLNNEQFDQRLKLKYCYTAEDLKLNNY